MDIAAWLREVGLERYEQAFRDNDVDAKVLPHLTAEDLKDIGITSVGHRRSLLAAIEALRPEITIPEPEEPRRRRRLFSEAERRQLTVMFVDLVGSTALSARLDPEDLRLVIGTFRDTVAAEVARFDGFVAQYLGDGILAYFGWPRAHEDDAERAVRAGLAAVDTVTGLATPVGRALAARVGIATGVVVVGDLIGQQDSQQRAVVGETPNLAARMQTLAQPGRVVIAETTRRLLGGGFTLEDLGERELKGVGGPVRAYLVTGERPLQSRFEAKSGPALLPMVGRDQELALLLERWALVKAGEGQGVLLVGEAGIGKSRISRALLDALAVETHFRIRYQCSPYHTDSALWPVIQQLSYAAALAADDALEARLDKLEALLERAGGQGAAPLIADLLGLDGSARYGPLDLTPQAQRARTLEALVEQMLGLAARQPVLVVLEDAHWIDPTTLEMIEQGLDRIADARVLILLTSRPDRQPALAAHPHMTRLTLNRLGRAGVEAIVARLGGDRLSGEVIETIIARTDGVPLFVEELTKAILDAGETTVPASLHDSLMARLDRIPEVKQIAQIGACIGREFDYPLLAAIADRPESDLQSSLDELATAELIFRRGTPPNVRYTFKHALVQDAAYSTLLRKRREGLHRRIGEAIEQLYAEREDEVCHMLAHHFAAADQPAKAVAYLCRRADQLARSYALVEMEATLRRGLECAAALGDEAERTRWRLAFKQRLSHCLYFLARFEESEEVLLDERALLESDVEPQATAPCLFALSHILLRLARYEEAARAATKAIEQAERCGDMVTAGKAYGALCFHGSLVGDAEAGTEAGKRSIERLAKGNEPYWLGMTHFYQGMVDISIGRFASAIDGADVVVAIGESCGDARLQTYGRFLRGWALANQGDHRRAQVECRQAVALAPDPTSRAYATSFLAYCYLEEGEPGMALPALIKAVDAIQAVKVGPWVGYFMAMLSEAQRLTGNRDVAAAMAERAIEAATALYYPLGLGWAQRAGAKAVWTTDPNEGECRLENAIATFEAMGAAFEAARTRLDLAQALEHKSSARAQEQRMKAAELLRGLGLAISAIQYRFGLDRRATIADRGAVNH
jgi:class 3 adenylate cyclase/tetratricopeptide (TPR) repeat protein